MITEHPRIAVVDDEGPVRKAIQRLLRSFGMEVDAYASGTEFLEAVRIRAPDCVVLDLHMPGLSGFDVQARLVAPGMQVPVIVITGYDMPETRARVMAGGATAYLLKPIDEHVLLNAIRTALAEGSR